MIRLEWAGRTAAQAAAQAVATAAELAAERRVREQLCDLAEQTHYPRLACRPSDRLVVSVDLGEAAWVAAREKLSPAQCVVALLTLHRWRLGDG